MRKIILIIIVAPLLFLLLPADVKEKTIQHINFVSVRLSNTLFADERRLDERDGRSDESKMAIKTFDNRSGILPELFGYGHGFCFFNSREEQIQAHIHITPVAYYVKYGIIGVILYLTISGIIFSKTIRLFISKREQENVFRYHLLLCSVLLIIGSFVAGCLTNISAWFIIGISIGRFNSKRVY